MGIVYSRYNLGATLHFEADYVEFDKLPSIRDGYLTFSGTSKNGVCFHTKKDIGITLHYDPPP